MFELVGAEVGRQLLLSLFVTNVHQRAPVHSIESRAPALCEPDLEADLAWQTVAERQALAFPVIGAEEGLLELLFEGIAVRYVKGAKLATLCID